MSHTILPHKEDKQPHTRHCGFAQVPRLVTRGEFEIEEDGKVKKVKLSLIEKGLYTCLKDICGDDGECFYTLRHLASEINTSISTLSRYIPLLQSYGMITAVKKPTRHNKHEIWHIRIVNIWQQNDKLYAPPQLHNTVSERNNTVSERNNTVSERNNKYGAQGQDCFSLNARVRVSNNNQREEDITAQSPIGELCSSFSSSSENTQEDEPTPPSQLDATMQQIQAKHPPAAVQPVAQSGKPGRKAKGLSETETAVMEKLDSLQFFAVDCSDRSTKQAIVYFAEQVGRGRMALGDITQVWAHVQETNMLKKPFYGGVMTLAQFKYVFFSILGTLRTSSIASTSTSLDRYASGSSTSYIEQNAARNAMGPETASGTSTQDEPQFDENTDTDLVKYKALLKEHVNGLQEDPTPFFMRDPQRYMELERASMPPCPPRNSKHLSHILTHQQAS